VKIRELPIGTPLNAIAFSTGTVETEKIAKVGTLLSSIRILVLDMPYTAGVKSDNR